MANQKQILVSVLNWGLGHAVRSIPIIDALLKNDFLVHLASDGLALKFLQKSYPNLPFHTLAPLHISYSKSQNQLGTLAKHTLHMQRWFEQDKKRTNEILTQENFCGIISDNRPGVFSNNCPSVYLTHQLRVEAGFFSAFSTFLHKKLMQPFDEIWVPDVADLPGMSGKLGHAKSTFKIKYIGPLSTFSPASGEKEFDISIVLSGPEPQRSLLENKLISQLHDADLSVILLRGCTQKPEIEIPAHWQVKNLANRQDVQTAFAKSKVLIARNGYTTLMDLYAAPMPALLVPTPGQPEQEYLASLKNHRENFAHMAQHQLDVKMGIEHAEQAFTQFSPFSFQRDSNSLFSLFRG